MRCEWTLVVRPFAALVQVISHVRLYIVIDAHTQGSVRIHESHHFGRPRRGGLICTFPRCSKIGDDRQNHLGRTTRTRSPRRSRTARRARAPRRRAPPQPLLAVLGRVGRQLQEARRRHAPRAATPQNRATPRPWRRAARRAAARQQQLARDAAHHRECRAHGGDERVEHRRVGARVDHAKAPTVAPTKATPRWPAHRPARPVGAVLEEPVLQPARAGASPRGGRTPGRRRGGRARRRR